MSDKAYFKPMRIYILIQVHPRVPPFQVAPGSLDPHFPKILHPIL